MSSKITKTELNNPDDVTTNKNYKAFKFEETVEQILIDL